ncbi:MAG: sulfatase [Candidatus Krumholzibacteria bacterium]|nr:sulfatase [Candidatus Krumholzibacteria bacterium]
MSEVPRQKRRNVRFAAWAALIGVFVTGAVITAVLRGWLTPPYDGPYRHVVLISLDTLRADHLACYGHPDVQTPNIDALAANGIRFDQVVSAAPTTLAAHTSIMTGTYPHTHGVARNGFIVNEDNVLLAEVLAKAGFTSAGFIGAFALDSRFQLDQGFEHFDTEYDDGTPLADGGQVQRRADRVTDAAIAFLDRGLPERLFLFVHYFDAHAPYDAPAPYGAMYLTDEAIEAQSPPTDMAQAADRQQRHTLGRALGRGKTMTDGLTQPLILNANGKPVGDDLQIAARYRGEISFLDHHLGRLIEYLRTQGILENAVIVVTSDHGETMWEHGDFWNHGLWVYDTTVRVPLIIRLPGALHAETVVRDVASTTDIMPTVLALLELPVPETVYGRSLVSGWTGGPLEQEPVFSEATQPFRVRKDVYNWANGGKPKCVRQGRWKYIHAPYLDLEELYDIQTDPAERNNLLLAPSEEAKDKAEELRRVLQDWRADSNPLPSSFATKKHKDTLNRLRSLGYVGTGPDEKGTEENGK